MAPLIKGNQLDSHRPMTPDPVPIITNQDITISPSTEHADPLLQMVQAAYGVFLLIIFGYFREFLSLIGITSTHSFDKEHDREGYVPLFDEKDRFFRLRMVNRVAEWACPPLYSMAGPIIKIGSKSYDKIRNKWVPDGNYAISMNMASYNYLEMNQNEGPMADAVQSEIEHQGIGICSTQHELGSLSSHKELEQLVSTFLGVDDAVIVGMGFATNSLNIPCLVGSDTLVLSDSNNHSSIALGCKLSMSSSAASASNGSVIRPFKHNDMNDLEQNLINGIVNGNPKTKKPFKKIIIIVEGVYSMEGSVVHLKEVVALKKKYKAYLYMDEAHSIGSMGQTGRGVCEHEGVDPRDVDILMGTFTKSFGAAGGYLAGNREVIKYIRSQCGSHCYGTSMSPPIVRQVICSLETLMDKVIGGNKVTQLAENTKFFRSRLTQEGFNVIGDDASPVVPILLYSFSSTKYMFLKLAYHGVTVVGVGPPATPILKARLRFCISSGHTREQLQRVLDIIVYYADLGHIYRKVKPRKLSLKSYGITFPATHGTSDMNNNNDLKSRAISVRGSDNG